MFDKVKRGINYPAFYSKHIVDFNPESKVQLCVFHKDAEPSLSIDLVTGLFHCFACGVEGNVFDFRQRKENLPTLLDAAKAFAAELGISDTLKKIIDPAIAIEYHNDLLTLPEKIYYLTHVRGLTLDTIKQFKLGWNGRRFSIPIYDKHGDLVNIRLYKSNAKERKVINYTAGEIAFGSVKLFPIQNVQADSILLCEGELDTIIACQNGFTALTQTAGATTWKAKFNSLFAGKTVSIAYDNDTAGDAGAKIVAKNLVPFCKVKIIHLDLPEIGADISDWFNKENKTAADLQRLIDSAPIQVAEKIIKAVDAPPKEVQLHESGWAEYDGKLLTCVAKVAGKDLSPYIVPKTLRTQCQLEAGKLCAFCPVAETQNLVTAIDNNDADLLKFVGVGSTVLRGLLKDKIGVPAKCAYAQISKLESINIQELRVIPETVFTEDTAKYCIRQVYNAYTQGNEVDLNKVYTMTGRCIAHPKNQYATNLMYEIGHAQDSIEAFEITDQVLEHINLFKAIDAASLNKKMDILLDDLETVTRIIGRRDLLTGLLLTFGSPLFFDFHGITYRGWIDALIIGDTRSGKTQAVRRFMDYARLGQMVSGEAASYAGIIGGLQKVNDRWSLQWGAAPLNDRKILVIDEASGIGIEEISKMSSVRSSGIAEITKIQTESTHSRTRLLWLSNPRSERGMASYANGVKAVRDLMGRLEDVARLDFAITCASGEVPIDKINTEKYDKPLTFTGEALHNLILWIWKRIKDDIVITGEAEKIILEYATVQGRKYSSAIPLVEPAEQRIKLARIACAIACLSASTTDNERVLVQAYHVAWAYNFLEQTYCKLSMGYDTFSNSIGVKQELEFVAELTLAIKPDTAGYLLEEDKIIQADLETIFNLDRDGVRGVLNLLRRANAIQRVGTSFYRKTPPFINWLRERVLETAEPTTEIAI